MRFTNTSLVLVWLITLALFMLAGFGVIAGSWLFVLLAVALAAPTLLLRTTPELPESGR